MKEKEWSVGRYEQESQLPWEIIHSWDLTCSRLNCRLKDLNLFNSIYRVPGWPPHHRLLGKPILGKPVLGNSGELMLEGGDTEVNEYGEKCVTSSRLSNTCAVFSRLPWLHPSTIQLRLPRSDISALGIFTLPQSHFLSGRSECISQVIDNKSSFLGRIEKWVLL